MKLIDDCTKGAVILTSICALSIIIAPVAAIAAGGGGGSHWAATDTYKVMNFAVLAIALIFLLKKPISQALNKRIEGIREQLKELEEKKKSAETELAAYNEKLAKLEAEAQQIVDEYVQQGQASKVRILKEAEETVEKMEAQAKKNIENAFMQAKERLKREIVDEAMARAEAMIMGAISADDQSKLVDEYLQKVVA